MTDKNEKITMNINGEEINLPTFENLKVSSPTLEDYADFIMEIEGEKLNVKILMSDFERVKSKIKGAETKKENKEKFYPISELKKYKNKYIKEITIKYKDGYCEHFVGDNYDILLVDEDGNFYLSDFSYGIIDYNEKEESYGLHYHYHYKKLNIIGYYNLVLE